MSHTCESCGARFDYKCMLVDHCQREHPPLPVAVAPAPQPKDRKLAGKLLFGALLTFGVTLLLVDLTALGEAVYQVQRIISM